jgi:hypothetical protein
LSEFGKAKNEELILRLNHEVFASSTWVSSKPDCVESSLIRGKVKSETRELGGKFRVRSSASPLPARTLITSTATKERVLQATLRVIHSCRRKRAKKLQSNKKERKNEKRKDED